MTRTASIVSFDDAKRSRGARTRIRGGQQGGPSASERPLVYFDPGANARFKAPSNRSGRSAEASARSTERSASAHAHRVRRTGEASATSLTAPRSVPLSRRTSAGNAGTPSWYDGPDERAVRDEAQRRARIRQEAREVEQEGQGEKASPLQKLRRAAAKRKADKVFGAADGSAASGEGGPRAALYKGEMGSSQRRASRMQDGSESESESARVRSKKRFAFGPRIRIAVVALGCLALICVFLYQPVQQYYQSMRARDALALEYAALQERGEALQSNVDTLSSDAGMEDLAHEQYGLVKEGETAVNVSGVEDSSDGSSTIPPNVSADSIDPPDTWYSSILDPLFGVE